MKIISASCEILTMALQSIKIAAQTLKFFSYAAYRTHSSEEFLLLPTLRLVFVFVFVYLTRWRRRCFWKAPPPRLVAACVVDHPWSWPAWVVNVLRFFALFFFSFFRKQWWCAGAISLSWNSWVWLTFWEFWVEFELNPFFGKRA